MNYGGRYRRMEPKPCRVCGMYSGIRKVTTKVPEKFFVVCEVCGYKTHPHNTQSGATREWNNERNKDNAEN